MLITKSKAERQRIVCKNKILIWFLVSITFLLVPVLIEIIKPIDLILKYKLRLKEGSTLYELLQHEIPAARLSLYIFNITNGEQFLSGEDEKLKVEEVGPFVFQEYRWYEEMEVSADGKEVSMTPKIRSEFDLEASVADIKDISLHLPNLPLLASSSILSNYPSLVQFTFTMLVQQLKSKAIMEINVYDYLWGFDDPILKICNNLAPSFIYFQKLGLLDRFYDNNSEYRITVGATDEDRFKIKSLKKTTRINLGDIQDVDETEQTFEDTYEGIGYPPELSPSLPLNLYRVGVCKTFNLEYVGSRNMEYGGEGSVYTISNQTFMNDIDPITKRRFPDGVMSIAPCFYGLPYVASKGHFVDADPVYFEKVEGLHPDPKVHLNEIIIDKKVSVTFDTKMSLQVNLILNDITYNRVTRMFFNITVPIVHIKVTQPPMTPSTMYKFILAFQIGPYLILATKICTIIIGLISLSYALKLLYLKKRYTESVTFEAKLTEKLILTNTPILSEYQNNKRPSIIIRL